MSVRKDTPPMSTPCSSEQFLVTDWDPLNSMDQRMKFSCTAGLSSCNVGNPSSSALERLPSLSCFSSESLSEIMGSFALPESTQLASALGPQGFPLTNQHGIEKNVKGKKRKRIPECAALQSDSPFVKIHQKVEAGQQKDVPIEVVNTSAEKDDKKQKNELNSSANDQLQNGGDATKEDYIHIRAKRGQATNSHSLAERVRREKISERMRLLQDLVPGCNKITGKAVMLDEIINYVQSLQKQVEFLSMKLATVNPELNLDIEQIFSKEGLSTRYGSTSGLGYGPEIGTTHPHLQAEMAMPCMPNLRDMLRITTSPQICPMAQISNPWDDSFQSVVHMGFISNLPIESMEPNGSMKVEL